MKQGIELVLDAVIRTMWRYPVCWTLMKTVLFLVLLCTGLKSVLPPVTGGPELRPFVD